MAEDDVTKSECFSQGLQSLALVIQMELCMCDVKIVLKHTHHLLLIHLITTEGLPMSITLLEVVKGFLDIFLSVVVKSELLM